MSKLYEKIGEYNAKVIGRTMLVSLCYPRVDNNINAVEIDLEDVRASDSLRVMYSHDRNGWVVMQEEFSDFDGEEEMAPQWVEVAFCASWALER